MDGTAMKDSRIIIPTTLQDKTLKELHLNHMGTQKTRLLGNESICWMNMNAGIEEMVKKCPTCLDFKATQQRDKTMSHEILGRLWESVAVDIFTINKKHDLHIVDYHGKFLIIKQVE